MAGTVKVDTVQSSASATPPVFKDSAGTEMGQLCRAWVNFYGVTAVTVRASFNVSSVVRNATGDYTVNFTNAFPDANYAVTTMLDKNTAAGGSTPLTLAIYSNAAAPTASACRVCGMNAGASSLADTGYSMLAFFR